MKMPFRENAYIPRSKLINYILSETHTIGKLKARFFKSAGFNETNVSLLEKSLLRIAHTEEVKSMNESIYGTKYIIDGKITASKNKVIKLRTVWILEANQKTPRFITVYPV